MAPGDSLPYTVTVLPVTADDKSWSVSSSDSTIATAGSSFLHAITMGSAQVRVRSHDADRRDTCYVTVMNDSAYASGIISTYESSCYSALHTIRVAGGGNQFIVQNGGYAEMIAGEKILYLPGTKVEQGGYLHGYIATQGPWCSNTKNLVENSNDPAPFTGWLVKASPNPTSGALHLIFNTNDLATPVRITVYNLLGEKVFSDKITGQSEYSVSMESIQPGMYLLLISQGIRRELVKIIRD
jgi:hypothetical protein